MRRRGKGREAGEGVEAGEVRGGEGEKRLGRRGREGGKREGEYIFTMGSSLGYLMVRPEDFMLGII